MKTFIRFSYVCIYLIVNITNAQNENNNWYFGNHAGLNFASNPPTPLNNSAMYSSEGCSTVSDANGSLLFYTDGITV